jgi:hypothetical protein
VAPAVTAPRAFLGFTPGDDKKLANYKQSAAYFRKLATETDRMRLFEIGKSSEGETMLLAAISSPENLARLDRLKQVARTLADGRVPEAEARALSKEGRAMVWIDGGLHATEVGCAQHAINLGYDLVAREDDEYKRIRANCVVLLVPDPEPRRPEPRRGLVPQAPRHAPEGTPLPVLYQKYAGHDNNRDWYMLNLPETRVITRQLYHEWLPQVVYNHHQAGNMFPERMFVPPYDGPLNPNIPPLAVRGVNALGTAMQTRLAQENKTGVISLDTYTAWWDGGMRSTPFFHNTIGVLTEVAHPSPYPGEYKVPAAQQEPTLWYHDPYKGGVWRFADTVAYMNAGSMGLLNWAVGRAEDLQMDRWRMARAAVARGTSEAPYGFIVPLDADRQRDPNTAVLLLERVRQGAWRCAARPSPSPTAARPTRTGTAVLLAAQPNRRTSSTCSRRRSTRRCARARRPADPALRHRRVDADAPDGRHRRADGLRPVRRDAGRPRCPGRGGDRPAVPAVAGSPGGWRVPAPGRAPPPLLPPLTACSQPASPCPGGRRGGASGACATRQGRSSSPRPPPPARRSPPRRRSCACPSPPPEACRPHRPRRRALAPRPRGDVRPVRGNMPQGWTQLVLESFAFPHTPVTNPDIRSGKLKGKIDALILTTFPNARDRTAGASETATATTNPSGVSAADRRGGLGPGFLGGPRPKELALDVEAGLDGIGTMGEENLRRFVEEGGTLVAIDAAVARTVELFGLPLRDVTAGTKFYSPGSVFRVHVDPADPLCWGLPREVNVFFDKGAAFESALSFASTSQGGAFALYPTRTRCSRLGDRGPGDPPQGRRRVVPDRAGARGRLRLRRHLPRPAAHGLPAPLQRALSDGAAAVKPARCRAP